MTSTKQKRQPATVPEEEQKQQLGLTVGDDGLPVFVGESWEDHVSAWLQASEELDERQWQLGAIADSLDRSYGKQGVMKFAGEVCRPARTIWQYAQVYRFYKEGERSETLSWSHHMVAMNAQEPKEVLDRAEDENWSVEAMKKFLKTGAVDMAEPQFVFKFRPRRRNENRGLYRKEMDAEYEAQAAEYVETH